MTILRKIWIMEKRMQQGFHFDLAIFPPSRASHFVWNPTDNGCYCCRPCHYIYKIWYRFTFILEPWNFHLNGFRQNPTRTPSVCSFCILMKLVETSPPSLIWFFLKIDKTHYQCFFSLIVILIEAYSELCPSFGSILSSK